MKPTPSWSIDRSVIALTPPALVGRQTVEPAMESLVVWAGLVGSLEHLVVGRAEGVTLKQVSRINHGSCRRWIHHYVDYFS